MLDQVLRLFQIQPDYELNVMQANQSLSQLTASLFTSLDRVVGEAKPDWILAQGDTTTAFVAAMVAQYHGTSFGHIGGRALASRSRNCVWLYAISHDSTRTMASSLFIQCI